MKSFLILISLSFFLNSFGQNISVSETTNHSNWTLYSQGEVNIYYKISPCKIQNLWDQERVLLKFENTSDKNIEYNYSKNLSYSNWSQQSLDNPTIKIKLKPLENIEGTCDIEETKDVYIFSKSIDPKVVIKSELLTFSLKPQK